MVANFVDYSELSHDARRALEKEREKRMESVHEVDEFLQMLESADELVSNANELAIELERQKAENDDLRARLQQMELQLNEMSKFSAVMAKKSSEDDVVKFIRVFVNRSKQKTIKKRALIKEMLLEFTYANGIVLPDDLMAAIYALDDEQPEAKIVIEKAGDVIAEGGVKNVTNNYYGKPEGELTEDLTLTDISQVPACLKTEEAEELMEELSRAGLLSEDWQPRVSRPEAALMANMLSEKLGIAHKWKVFEQLWSRNNMRSDYNTALEQRKSLEFQEKLKKVLF